MNAELFDPAEHEPLVESPWDPQAARAFVERIVREFDAAYDGSGTWPVHPEDAYEDDPPRAHGLYDGGAGTMWAIARLAARYALPLRHDYADEIVRCEDAYHRGPRETDTVVPSYFLGTVGIVLARYALTGDDAVLERLAADMAANVGNVAREALWGSPGTAVASLLIRERDGDDRFDAPLRATQRELWSTWLTDGEAAWLWEQELYGERRFFVGAGHGAIGNLAPLIRAPDLLDAAQRADLRERVAALLERYAIVENGAANWWSFGNPLSRNRLQWCHGAVGVIIGLANYPNDDERVENLLLAAGEATWRAGPLRKGPTLCHGTAGNGFAFLRLAQRTGDARWTRRAERFAMHAIAQVSAWRETFGMPSASLYTGDVGVAVYVDAVLRDDLAILTLDTM